MEPRNSELIKKDILDALETVIDPDDFDYDGLSLDEFIG